MAKIDALDVWRKACASDWCQEACNFFRKHGIDGGQILERGSANFDSKVTGLAGEQPWYRAAYYAGPNGYMNMHIKQNLAAFRQILPLQNFEDKQCLFVDFGCGPMSAGLAFAEVLTSAFRTYRNNFSYLGIDASSNMTSIADWINGSDTEQEILGAALFEQGTDLDLLEQLIDSLMDVNVAVLSLSFVLAPGTNAIPISQQNQWAVNLIERWHNAVSNMKHCRQSYIIYLNPYPSNLHGAWDHIVNYFSGDRKLKGWMYSSDSKLLRSDNLPNPYYAGLITGKRTN